MIPTQSQASIKNGIWFIHTDDTNTIQVWGSCINGKEKVYINDELVSEQSSMKMKSAHNFKDKNGQSYEVQFITESILKGGLECLIKKDNIILKSYKAKYVRGKLFSFKKFLIIILASAIFGVASSLYDLPNFYFILFLVIVLVVQFITRDRGKFVIE